MAFNKASLRTWHLDGIPHPFPESDDESVVEIVWPGFEEGEKASLVCADKVVNGFLAVKVFDLHSPGINIWLCGKIMFIIIINLACVFVLNISTTCAKNELEAWNTRLNFWHR